MEAALKLWAVIFAVGALNYLSRLSFIAFFARRTMPPLLARALKYVPAAMLTALIVPMVVDVGTAARVSISTPQGRRGGVWPRSFAYLQHAKTLGAGMLARGCCSGRALIRLLCRSADYRIAP